ncbi:MAG TPA: hypothetical protein ENH23_00630 [candidate division Zixibacteria bacterium]|nr:hypothetical protein [candidate division Zixibacteria bacterium]
MSAGNQKKLRKEEIVINYVSLILLTFIMYYGKTHEFGYTLIGGGVFCLAANRSGLQCEGIDISKMLSDIAGNI